MARRITLKLYATLGELLPPGAHENAAQVEVPDDATLNEVIDRYRVPRELAHLVLINGFFVCAEDRDLPGRLEEGDTLAIWPPVAGGAGGGDNSRQCFRTGPPGRAKEGRTWLK